MQIIVKGKPGPYEKIAGMVVESNILVADESIDAWFLIWDKETNELELCPACHMIVDFEMMKAISEENMRMNNMGLIEVPKH